MASFEEHCQDCIDELGEPFPQVHNWLDALFGKLGPKHRDARHHTEGVEGVRKAWGPKAARAAEIHILKDCYGSIPTPEEIQMTNLCWFKG